MSIKSSQLQTVRALMDHRRDYAGTAGATTTTDLKVVAAPRASQAPRSVDAPHAEVRGALGDIVLSVSAVDAAVAIERGSDLRVVTSVRGLIGRRTLSREMSPAVWESIEAGHPLWIADPATAGVHLPPHSEVLAVPFIAGDRPAVALLSFHNRRHFSTTDLRWLQHVLTVAATRDALAASGTRAADEGVAA